MARARPAPAHAAVVEPAHALSVAMSISTVFALGAGVLLARGVAGGNGYRALGLACVLVVVLIQVFARRTARRQLEQAGMARGLDASAAAVEARAMLRRWLA